MELYHECLISMQSFFFFVFFSSRVDLLEFYAGSVPEPEQMYDPLQFLLSLSRWSNNMIDGK